MPKSTVDTQATMERVPAQPPVPEADQPAGEREERRTWLRRTVTSTATVAIVTWLVATPAAFVLARAWDLDPFTPRGAFASLGAGGLLLVVLTALAWWRRAGEWVPAVATGLFAAWVALALRVALNGSPFGTTGLEGDRVRVSAAAVRYTVTFWPADHFIEGLPPEYPPLYPWLTGMAARILDLPAWRMLGYVDVGVLSFAVVAAFLMWRRVVPAAIAFPLSAVGLLIYGDPRKAFAVITLFVFIPWVIVAFADPPRGRMHWLPAGVIGGLIMLTYNGWFPFAGFGVVAILVATWRRVADRTRYVRHILLLGVVALVVSAPYLVPYFSTALTAGGQPVSDLYAPSGIESNGFPFLAPTLVGALELVGLAGLLWYRNRRWWSWPLLYLVLGSYLFWLLMGIRYVMTGHTTLFYYAFLITASTQLIAGVLTLVEAGPALARRFGVTPPHRIGAAVTAVAMVWIGFSYWQAWRPFPTLGVSTFNDYTTWAHLEPLPDCSYPKYAPRDGRIACDPVDRVRTEVERVLGAGARPHTLASDERLFAFLPWRGYMGVDRTSGNTLAHWDDRHAEVTRLSELTDPAEFAKASSDTRFGPIDVFVLGRADARTWTVIDRQFRPEQFDPSVWTVVDLPAERTVVVIRRAS